MFLLKPLTGRILLKPLKGQFLLKPLTGRNSAPVANIARHLLKPLTGRILLKPLTGRISAPVARIEPKPCSKCLYKLSHLYGSSNENENGLPLASIKKEAYLKHAIITLIAFDTVTVYTVFVTPYTRFVTI